MTEWIKSAGMASWAAMRSTASLKESTGKEATGGAGTAAEAGAGATRSGTTPAAMARAATGLEVTITLLTSLPVRASARTTQVIRCGRSGRPAADKRVGKEGR